MSSFIKLQFFSILNNENSQSNKSNLNILSREIDNSSNLIKNNKIFNDLNILDMWVVKKQVYLLCKKYIEGEKSLAYLIYKIENNIVIGIYQVYNRTIFSGKIIRYVKSDCSIGNLSTNQTKKEFSATIVKPKNSTSQLSLASAFVSNFTNFNSFIESNNNNANNTFINNNNTNLNDNSANQSMIHITSKSPKNLDNSHLSTTPHNIREINNYTSYKSMSEILNEKYYLVLCGSDYMENINEEEKKKDLNIMTYISIFDLSSLEKEDINDISGNLLNNSNNNINKINITFLKPSIIKQINLITIPNSIFLNTTNQYPKSFESLSGISCMDISNNLSFIAIGTETGKVILIYPEEMSFSFVNKNVKNYNKINTTSTTTSTSKTIINKKIVSLIYSTKEVAVELNDLKDKFCINSIAFSRIKSHKGDFYILYFSTFNAVYYYGIDLIFGKITYHQLSKTLGTFSNSIVLSNKSGQVFFNSKDKIVEYYNLNMKSTIPFEGRISSPIFLESNYLAFVLNDGNTNALAVFDIKNKFFSYYNNIFNNIISLKVDLFDGSLYFLVENNQGIKQILSLKEKENFVKFNAFYKKHLFELAFDYARSLKYSIKEISEINKVYGDHLYNNNEYQRSVEQYVKTILYIHPSQIIEKFLDNSKIEYLIYYLESIHNSEAFKNKFKSEMANYSKLLINIYSKLKKTSKLDMFIDKFDFTTLEQNDIDNLINVYLEQNQMKVALNIANKAKYSQRISEIFLESKSK